MWAMLSSELLSFVGRGSSRYPLGTTVAVMVVFLLVVILIRRLTIGEGMRWRWLWRVYVTRIILGFCVLFAWLMKPPTVVAITILVVVTVLWYYLPWRYRDDT
jgi:hypothetical protein